MAYAAAANRGTVESFGEQSWLQDWRRRQGALIETEQRRAQAIKTREAGAEGCEKKPLVFERVGSQLHHRTTYIAANIEGFGLPVNMDDEQLFAAMDAMAEVDPERLAARDVIQNQLDGELELISRILIAANNQGEPVAEAYAEVLAASLLIATAEQALLWRERDAQTIGIMVGQSFNRQFSYATLFKQAQMMSPSKTRLTDFRTSVSNRVKHIARAAEDGSRTRMVLDLVATLTSAVPKLSLVPTEPILVRARA